MACSSLTSLTRDCGVQGNPGGNNQLFMIAFADLDGSSGSVYGLSGSVISGITLNSGKTFVEIELIKDGLQVKDSATVDPTKDQFFFIQTVSLFLGAQSPEKADFIVTAGRQPVAGIFKSRTGKYYAFGLSGNVYMTKADGDTGKAETDAPGYTLEFSGSDPDIMREVDASIVSSLVA